MTGPGPPHMSGDQEGAYQLLAGLLREWASAIGTTADPPMSPADTHSYLGDLVQRLEAALSGSVVDLQAISEVGARLVAEDFTGPRSLSRTVEVLAGGLPRTLLDTATPPPTNRIATLLGALVAGYVDALHDRLFHKQEGIKRRLLAVQQDIERDARTSAARFDELFHSSDVGIAISEPDGRIVRTNPALEGILGYLQGEMSGLELNDLFASVDQAVLQLHYFRLCAGNVPQFRTQVQLLRKDGETAWAHLTISVLRDAAQASPQLAIMVHDITELHLLREEFTHHLLHDLQTGLPNRQYLVSHLEETLSLFEPSAVITLLRLDLDGFSVINDGLGLRFGDQVLNLVARRLESAVAGHKAMVARLAGDEYAILIRPGESVPDIGWLVETVNSALGEPFSLGDLKVALTASIGIVQRQVAAAEPADLLRAASCALRRSRGSSGPQWTMFDADIDAADRAELRLAAAMYGALDNGELGVGYQPVVALDSGRMTGLEAVLSWQHPQLGALSHERCMQLAERTGVVRPVGQWLLRTAADQARLWREQLGDELPPIVLNLTHYQAQDPDLLVQVRAVLTELGLRPNTLELRVPVSALCMVNGAQSGAAGGEAEDNLRVLADLGVRMALHDFGAGIGGLGCLAELPVHAVRIAQPMGRQVAGDPFAIPAQALRAVVPIMRSAGVGVVACAVDTERLADWWRSAGADCAVGKLFAQPSPPHDIERLLGIPASGRLTLSPAIQ